jgi:anaerobic magnesium-protoporphyrin IX monomethyl ester cyclase
MKILLAVKSKALENLGVMYLSSIAKQAGHDCRIVEFKEVFDWISWKPKIIGFSVMTGDQGYVKGLADAFPAQKVIVGGPHVSFFPEDFPGVTIVQGEGENAFAEIIGYRKTFPDLDSIPWPDRTHFPGMKIRDFISSRGCPHSCAYCYSQKWAEISPDIPRVRFRSVDDVIAETKVVGGAFNYYQDACFGLNRKWMIDFCEKYWVSVKRPFHVHLRPSQVDIEMASHLAMAGCYSVRFALETASDKLRKLINREHTSNEETYEASRLCRKYGIRFMIQNILGLCESTIEDDLNTLDVNIKSRPDYAWCSIFQPYPGTALGDYCKEKGLYSGDFSELSDSFFDKSVLNFSPEHKEQLECLQRVFALAVETSTMPKIEELTYEQFPKLVHRLMRKLGDRRLYAGII